jgi:DNA repair photolyase
LHYGFHVTILTKNSLVGNDLDIIEGRNVSLGATITTMDENLRRKIEPGASPTIERINILKEAANRGIKVWAFLGPLMPYLSDTRENIEALFKALAGLKLDRIYYDKLNPRSGVWRSLKSFLGENYPYLMESYGKILYNKIERENYIESLNKLMKEYAEKYNRTKEMGFER